MEIKILIIYSSDNVLTMMTSTLQTTFYNGKYCHSDNYWWRSI